MRNSLRMRVVAGVAVAALLMGCSGVEAASEKDGPTEAPYAETLVEQAATEDEGNEPQVTTVTSSGGVLLSEDVFTERDLEQTADLTDATYVTLADGQDVLIAEEGVYVIQGSASDVTIRVEADDAAKVQIVLDGVTITNADAPAIYVVSADKVFVTTTKSSTNALEVTGTFVPEGDTNLDAVIFSHDDLVLNGEGTLAISSTANGVSCKDDLKITGGELVVTCSEDALEANDSVAIAGGSLQLTAGKDAIHAENDDDATGYVYVCGGTISIDAGDDGIQGTALTQIDGGSIDIRADEGIEGTYVQVNGGTIDVYATDDGINASDKSTAYDTVLEINGGSVTVEMAQGDTDALDSNGYIYINGGTVDITAQSAFDFELGAELNGGEVTVNGEQVTTIANSMMGGPGMMGGTPGEMGETPGEMGGTPRDMGGGKGGPGF